MSVAVLSSGVVSPGGTATVAVFTRLPTSRRAAGLIWATAMKVTVPWGSRVTVVRMSPPPLAWATLEPTEATAVQLTEVMADGNRSVTCWSTAVLGPALVTTIVYVVLPPGVTDSTPLVLVMDRSDWGVSVSVSLAVSLSGLGSVTPAGGATVAMLVRSPVAEGLIWTVKLKVTVALTGRSTVVARAP